MALQSLGTLRDLSPPSSQAAAIDSTPSLIGPITLGTKRAGARSAGNPHAACDEEGAGNGIRAQSEAPALGESCRQRLIPVPNITAPALDPTEQIAKWRFQSLLTILLVVTLGTVAFAQDIRVVFAGRTSTESEQSIWRGVKLGEKEANILGRYTGQTYTVEQMRPEALIDATLENLPTAIVAAGTIEELRQLSAIYAPLNVAVFNVSSGDDDL